ncbi:MAG: hypothetical protein LJE95_04890, partial [Acidobacteria bacterium]|nr:hypothetical protein [Acidobacteriota bacterium]
MTRTGKLAVLMIAAVLGVGSSAASAGGQHALRQVTVPFTLDHNRMIVDVELVRPDGTIRRARAWVDTGTEVLIVTEPVARELGLDLSGFAAGGSKARHSVRTSSPAPALRIGGLPLDMTGIETYVRRGALIMPGVPAEVHVGASALRHDHVVLDYPARRLTVARPGVLKPWGVAVPCRVNPTTGLFMISATIDGRQVPLGLDAGSAGTWVSTELTSTWQARHPPWRHVTGALGSANFWGEKFERNGVLMRLPELSIGPILVRDVTVLGLGQRLFDWYSRKSAGPVAG